MISVNILTTEVFLEKLLCRSLLVHRIRYISNATQHHNFVRTGLGVNSAPHIYGRDNQRRPSSHIFSYRNISDFSTIDLQFAPTDRVEHRRRISNIQPTRPLYFPIQKKNLKVGTLGTENPRKSAAFSGFGNRRILRLKISTITTNTKKTKIVTVPNNGLQYSPTRPEFPD